MASKNMSKAGDEFSDDELSLSLARQRGDRWLPNRTPTTLKAVARFVDDVGFAVLFPAEKVQVPSLYEAVAGPDTVAWEHGMGEAESTIWTWKDALPAAGHAWSGKLLHRRASVVSPALLASLYSGHGELDDHQDFDLPPESHRIADALLHGPLPTSALRELIGDRNRYERGITELHRSLLVTSAGIFEQRSGWPATLVDLTCRVFDVGGGFDRAYATRRFLATVIEAKPTDLSKAFAWPVPVAKAELAKLAASGAARPIAGGSYRCSSD
jgi:hypothetical protein